MSYAATIEFMDSVYAAVPDISREAVRLKEGVMLWVCLTEWLAVTSVSLIVGFPVGV